MSIHKITAANEIKQLIQQYPDYTIGQVLFSFCRIATNTNGSGKLSDLLNISDKEIYNAIERAKTEEEVETEFFNTTA